ncbi:phospholipase A1-like isoform X1 [Malaya genurostris]|uniref:phospholipase A1-like isoform X1 n=2 Tax=Malaya genurostris TaxID=325434 RepID=UPI0026F3A98D|nr:phospholipase A1-like isoform X1 [Malaya genurostris]
MLAFAKCSSCVLQTYNKMTVTCILKSAAFATLFFILVAGDAPIVFPEDNDDNSLSSRLELDMDDMEYERDNEGDSHVPQLAIPRDEYQDYVRLPDKTGEFEVVSRMRVHESRKESKKYDAAEYVKFRFYARSNNYQPVELRFDEIQFLPDHHGFKMELPTKILIHGWLGSVESEVIEPLATEFLEQGNFNVIAVDWEQGAKTLLYPVARYRVPKVATLVAAVINKLLEFGQSPEQIGMIGHSLGAHVAGLAGKQTNRKVAFIIGLDPASPLFRFKKPIERLSATDAEYVEVIHTNGKALGFFKNIGKADFYPNGGISQPGCGWSLTCHHERSVLYFKESLRVKNYFANRCADVENLHAECSLGQSTLGGFELKRLNKKPSGVYYVLTADSSPFLRSNV